MLQNKGKNKIKPIFICYDRELKRFLCENNQISWCSGINKSSKHQFWIFMNTKELSDLIEQYNKDKIQT